MSLKIDISFPGGSVFIEDIDGFKARLSKDLRNTNGNWFYWSFRATFDRAGEYTFTFSDIGGVPTIGARGPAVSYDGGMTWEWLGAASAFRNPDGEGFRYTFDASRGNRVIFCMGMQYQTAHLDAFLARHADSPYLSRSVLEYTRKGRAVPLLRIQDPAASGQKKIFLSSRHHCCEMMATYALEGILESALADDELGRGLRSKIAFSVVPMVDMDGVVDGDQGKNRRPHDHARDYNDKPIYPEIAAIQRLFNTEKFEVSLDMHCPWLRDSFNEVIYFPGPENRRFEAELLRFSAILEQEAEPAAPYFAKDNILFGTSWNTNANFTQGRTVNAWAADLPFVRAILSLELPYANAREVTLTADSVRDSLGRALAKSLLRYCSQL